MSPSWIGKNVPRKEGVDKVTGRATYVDDLTFPDLLHGVTVRSPVARGRIRNIEFLPGVPWDEIVVATAKDIPGENTVKLIDVDQPLLADGEVRHCEEPILLLAHADKQVAERARQLVKFDIERLPSIHTIEDALAGHTIVWGTDNVFTRYRATKGDVDAAFARADHIVEGEYTTGAQEQMYIEPQGMIAMWDRDDGITVYGSLQCPFYVQTALGPPFALPPEKLRVIQQVTGGGFGGKEEYPSIIAGHAALLAMKAGRPVKLVYDRIEDVSASTKRHPSRTRHRTAVAKDGTLLAMEIEFVVDGGAYKTLSPVVLSRGTIHAAGPYRCPNVRVEAKAVATSTPPHGAFRGFGAPQSIFALERHLDRVAQVVGLDPVELRRRNLLRVGDTTAVGQVIREPIDLDQVLDAALDASGYVHKRERFDVDNRKGGPIRRGIGAAVFYHGAGFTGSGEVTLASIVGVRASADGHITVLAASTEIGQGTNTIFSQIAAEAAGIDPDRISLVQPDTLTVPNSGPTVASRTTMVVGGLVDKATRALVAKLRDAGLAPEKDFAAACREWFTTHDSLETQAKYEPPPGVAWDQDNFRGDAYARYAWAVYIAEVSVDLRTCEVKVEDFVAVQEIGKTVNPLLAAGQIEGGVAQAVGWAVYEDVVWREGAVANPQMTNYIIPTSVDTPPIRVFFVPPFEGAAAVPKGIGELPMDGPAPAIVSAIEQAVGVPLTRVPLLPEALLDAMEEHRRESA